MLIKEQEDMIARSLLTEKKSLRVFDFDDTLVKTTSFIYITHSDGKKSKLTPVNTQFTMKRMVMILIFQISTKLKTQRK